MGKRLMGLLIAAVLMAAGVAIADEMPVWLEGCGILFGEEMTGMTYQPWVLVGDDPATYDSLPEDHAMVMAVKRHNGSFWIRLPEGALEAAGVQSTDELCYKAIRFSIDSIEDYHAVGDPADGWGYFDAASFAVVGEVAEILLESAGDGEIRGMGYPVSLTPGAEDRVELVFVETEETEWPHGVQLGGQYDVMYLPETREVLVMAGTNG